MQLILINCLLFVDLYQIIRNPFKTRKAREIKYFMTIVLVLFLSVLIYNHSLAALSLDFELIDTSDRESWLLQFHQSLLIILFVITFIFASLIINKIRKKEIDRKLRHEIFWRYVTYFFYCCLLFSSCIIDLNQDLDIINFFNPNNDKTVQHSITNLKYLLFMVVGTLIIFLRLSEPYVLHELRYQMRRCCFCRHSKRSKKIKFSDESLDSFLNS